MPCSEILRIVTTVATVQMICDLVAYWRIFSREPYQRAIEQLDRLKVKWDQVQAKEANASSKGSKKQDQNQKRVKRAEDDYKNALANVTRRHTVPNFFTSLVFLILMKVLGTELKGHIIAILPFEPFKILQKMTARNLEFNEAGVAALEDAGSKVVQACGFTFIYVLTSMSVKFYVHQLFGYKPPYGAENLTTLVDSPMGQNSTYIVFRHRNK